MSEKDEKPAEETPVRAPKHYHVVVEPFTIGGGDDTGEKSIVDQQSDQSGQGKE